MFCQISNFTNTGEGFWFGVIVLFVFASFLFLFKFVIFFCFPIISCITSKLVLANIDGIWIWLLTFWYDLHNLIQITWTVIAWFKLMLSCFNYENTTINLSQRLIKDVKGNIYKIIIILFSFPTRSLNQGPC